MTARGLLPVSIWITGPPVPAASRRAGSFADMIRAGTGDAWTGPWAQVDIVDERERLPGPGEVAAVIVTGSPARIADQLPWMRRAQQALRELVERNVPVLGICFGHQLLGMALGGLSGPNPRGREIGTVELITFDDDSLLPANRCFSVSMTHLDVVLQLPPGAEPIAATALDSYASIRFAEQAWGVQFHPEMNGAIMKDYIAALRGRLIDEGFDPDQLEAAVQDTPEAAAVLPRFARITAGVCDTAA